MKKSSREYQIQNREQCFWRGRENDEDGRIIRVKRCSEKDFRKEIRSYKGPKEVRETGPIDAEGLLRDGDRFEEEKSTA